MCSGVMSQRSGGGAESKGDGEQRRDGVGGRGVRVLNEEITKG